MVAAAQITEVFGLTHQLQQAIAAFDHQGGELVEGASWGGVIDAENLELGGGRRRAQLLLQQAGQAPQGDGLFAINRHHKAEPPLGPGLLQQQGPQGTDAGDRDLAGRGLKVAIGKRAALQPIGCPQRSWTIG